MNEFITVKQASELTGRAVRTIWQWLEKGYLTRYTQAKSTVIKKAELLDFISPKKA